MSAVAADAAQPVADVNDALALSVPTPHRTHTTRRRVVDGVTYRVALCGRVWHDSKTIATSDPITGEVRQLPGRRCVCVNCVPVPCPGCEAVKIVRAAAEAAPR